MGLIRLLLALAVVATHCGPIFGCNLVGGQIAVQSFFIISGFYMSVILNEKYVGVNNSYRLFITNRFMRLYPIYWAVFVATMLVCIGISYLNADHTAPVFVNYTSFKTSWFASTFLILINLLIFGQGLAMFLGLNPDGNLFLTANFRNTNPYVYTFLFIPQAWTLGLELTFYLIAPFILRRGLKTVVPLIIGAFLLRMVLYDRFHLQNDPWTYRFFPTEVMFFLLGYVSYRIYLKLKTKHIPPSYCRALLIFTVLFTILYTHLPTLKFGFLPFSMRDFAYFTTMLIAIPLLFNFLKKNRLDSKIGELSYPIYISHMLVLMICDVFSERLSSGFLKASWVVALLTIAVSYGLNIAIAAPIEKYRQSRLTKTRLQPAMQTPIQLRLF
ncbi:MAG TPA: acyltransferase [Puia sp.]|jgi:peptidoglycan/LPS O-acetylase OafA/YrhL|nr:acyltransferase [Puia sp.]